mmetsp:Transcript_4649/g.19797  ORF Transcript_4649/g.19797 Transcript_4649/m.19797 type:complete len:291 (+) Transcript_4649:992-1864(+)
MARETLRGTLLRRGHVPQMRDGANDGARELVQHLLVHRGEPPRVAFLLDAAASEDGGRRRAPRGDPRERVRGNHQRVHGGARRAGGGTYSAPRRRAGDGVGGGVQRRPVASDAGGVARREQVARHDGAEAADDPGGCDAYRGNVARTARRAEKRRRAGARPELGTRRLVRRGGVRRFGLELGVEIIRGGVRVFRHRRKVCAVLASERAGVPGRLPAQVGVRVELVHDAPRRDAPTRGGGGARGVEHDLLAHLGGVARAPVGGADGGARRAPRDGGADVEEHGRVLGARAR